MAREVAARAKRRLQRQLGQCSIPKNSIDPRKAQGIATFGLVFAMLGAEGYSDYKPNFCYERKWDSASKAEVGLIAGEFALGVAVGMFTSPSGPGAIAAYCGTTTAVSAAGAWLLAGTMAADKWPNGIIGQ